MNSSQIAAGIGTFVGVTALGALLGAALNTPCTSPAPLLCGPKPGAAVGMGMGALVAGAGGAAVALVDRPFRTAGLSTFLSFVGFVTLARSGVLDPLLRSASGSSNGQVAQGPTPPPSGP